MIAALSVAVASVAVATTQEADARSKKNRAMHQADRFAAQGWQASGYGWQGAGWNDPSAFAGHGRAARQAAGFDPGIESMVASAAAANGVPLELARRVVKRESGGNPRAVSKGNYGLMQIRLGTARAMGYGGGAAGLLDPQTNLTYAMKYLAGAHRAAGGSHDRAVSLYARGYYYEAKRQGFSAYETPGFSGAGVPSSGYSAYASAASTSGGQIYCNDRGCAPIAAGYAPGVARDGARGRRAQGRR
jgi:soluble lytic murein transglycosylase-like protein